MVQLLVNLFHVFFHPLLNPRAQKLIAAQDFENGWVVGRAYTLFTHGKFFEYFFKYLPVSLDYGWNMVNGGGAFVINAATGEITVSNIANFTSTTTITVRCTFTWGQITYAQNQDIEVIYVPVENAVYLDVNYAEENGVSNGSRLRPYNRARSYPSASRIGKTFFYKSGTVTTSEYLTFTNNISDPWTQFARWGIGARPLIDLSDNFTTSVQRFVNVGVSDTPGFNVRLCEVDFFNNVDAETPIAAYPFQIRGVSRNVEIYNSRMQGNIHRHGFIYCVIGGAVDYDLLNPNRIISNVEFLDRRFQDEFPADGGNRDVKLESPALVENCYSYTDFDGSVSASISCVDMPGGHVKYCMMHMDTPPENPDKNNLGSNIRVAYQTYECCISVGPKNGFVILNNHRSASGFQLDYPVDGTSWFKNCLAIGCDSAGFAFTDSENTSFDPPETTVGLTGLISVNCANGVLLDGGTRNVTVRSSLLCGNSANGVRQISGSGNRLINVTSVKNGAEDIRVESGLMEGINVLFGDKTGTFNETTCSQNEADFQDLLNDDFRPIEGSTLIAAGTHQGLSRDVFGYEFANPPSIGAFEFISADEPIDPPPVVPNFKVIPGLRFQLV